MNGCSYIWTITVSWKIFNWLKHLWSPQSLNFFSELICQSTPLDTKSLTVMVTENYFYFSRALLLNVTLNLRRAGMDQTDILNVHPYTAIFWQLVGAVFNKWQQRFKMHLRVLQMLVAGCCVVDHPCFAHVAVILLSWLGITIPMKTLGWKNPATEQKPSLYQVQQRI